MRILVGLMCVIMMAVALSGCDKKELSQESTAPAVVEETAPAEPVVEQAAPAEPVAEQISAAAPKDAAETASAAEVIRDPETVVVTVNGQVIKEGAISKEMNKQIEAMKKRMPASPEMSEQQKQRVRVAIEDKLVQDMILHQEMAKHNVTVSDETIMEKFTKALSEQGKTLEDVEKEIVEYGMTMDDVKTQIRPQVEMDVFSEIRAQDPQMQAEAKKFYDDNPAYFQVPEQVKASHILIGKRNATPEEKAVYLEKIRGVQAKLNAGGNFEELAKEYSACPSSAKGGDLGFFGRNEMDPAFEKVAFELQVGQTSDIVETGFGYHIIKVTDKKEAGRRPYEEAQKQIIPYLLRERMKETVVVYSEEEKAMRDRLEQQRKMQQQMMQEQMRGQMEKQAAEKAAAEAAATEPAAAEPADEQPAPVEEVKEKSAEAVKEAVTEPAATEPASEK